MRRTQLYLEDDLWSVLHKNAADAGSTVSELVRQALRERYLGNSAARKKAMENAVGLWADRKDLGDSTAYVRSLRRGSRIARLNRG